MNEYLTEFFSVIGKAKQEKEHEFRSLVGDINIDEIFNEVKKSVEEDKKKKIKKEKQAKALESCSYSESKIEDKKEESESKKEIIEKIEDELEIKNLHDNPKVEEQDDVIKENENIDKALSLLEKFKTKEQIQEKISDPEIIKIRRELEYLKNLVNTQGGGGETRLEFLDDVNRDSVKIDGKVLKYDSATGKFIGADVITLTGGVITGVSTTTTTTLESSIDSFSASSYRFAKYQILITQGSLYHTTEVSVVHDGSDSYITEYGTITTDSSLATFNSDVSGGNVRLLATPASSSSTTFNIIRTLVEV